MPRHAARGPLHRAERGLAHRAIGVVTVGSLALGVFAHQPPAASATLPPPNVETDAAGGFSLAEAEVAGRVLLRWAAATPVSRRAEILEPAVAGGLLVDAHPESVSHLVDVVRTHGDAAGVASTLAAHPDIVHAEPDQLLTIGTTTSTFASTAGAPRPDDPLFPQQWGLENTGQAIERDPSMPVIGTPGIDVRALDAWEATRGDETVLVAVIDTAVDADHPDLDGAVLAQVSTVVDDSGNRSHGTSVASVIAARAGDGYGMSGVAPGVSILSIAAFTATDDGPAASSMSSVLAAFALAREAGADVINASWVTPQDSPLLREAVAEAGVPVVAASGNEGVRLTADASIFPAGYELPNIVGVSALGPTGDVPRFANTGGEVVHVAAPGESIVAAFPVDMHGYADGTSYAAPMVSGALALAVSHSPWAATDDLVDAVSWTSRFQTSLQDTTISGGLVDAAALVEGVRRPVCRPDLLPAAGFTDVSTGNLHAAAIDCVTETGVTTGVGAGRFAPDGVVDRAQMAAFLYRVIQFAAPDVLESVPDDGSGTPSTDATDPDADTGTGDGTDTGTGDGTDTGTDTGTGDGTDTGTDSGTGDPTDPDADAGASDPVFDDVSPASLHYETITVLAELGVVRGDGTGSYRPAAPVSRAHLASLLVRTYTLIAGEVPPASRRWFDDTATNLHVNEIDQARDLGLARGTRIRAYDPASATHRDQMASLLARLLDALGRAAEEEA